MHLVLKLYKNKICNIHIRLRLTLQTNMGHACSTAVLSERNFRDGVERKLTSPLCGTQQAGGPETAAKSVSLLFIFTWD